MCACKFLGRTLHQCFYSRNWTRMRWPPPRNWTCPPNQCSSRTRVFATFDATNRCAVRISYAQRSRCLKIPPKRLREFAKGSRKLQMRTFHHYWTIHLNVRICHNETGKEQTVHVQRLKKFTPRIEPKEADSDSYKEIRVQNCKNHVQNLFRKSSTQTLTSRSSRKLRADRDWQTVTRNGHELLTKTGPTQKWTPRHRTSSTSTWKHEETALEHGK
jgi:hypothetical protein